MSAMGPVTLVISAWGGPYKYLDTFHIGTLPFYKDKSRQVCYFITGSLYRLEAIEKYV